MRKYVISYIDEYNRVIETVWEGCFVEDVLTDFWKSFDEVDKKKVSNVRVFYTVESIVIIHYGENHEQDSV